jgi:carboxypeptidase family protein
VWVVPGQGIHGTSRSLAGVVLSLNGALPGVVMQIVNGPNAGRTATTTSEGRFLMTDLRDGQFTIRLSKPGYVTAEYVWTIPGGSERITTLTAAPG